MSKTFTFVDAANAAVAIVKKDGALWNNLAGYVFNLVVHATQDTPATGEVLRETMMAALKNDEEAYANEHKGMKLSTIGAYRSAKSVVLAAVQAGIPLMEDGKVRGKSEVEAAIKETKGEKTPIEKFRIVHTSLASVADKLLTEVEVLEALHLLNETMAALNTYRATIATK